MKTKVERQPGGDPHDPGSDPRKRRRIKNYVLLAVLVAFVVLVYLVALVRMGGA